MDWLKKCLGQISPIYMENGWNKRVFGSILADLHRKWIDWRSVWVRSRRSTQKMDGLTECLGQISPIYAENGLTFSQIVFVLMTFLLLRRVKIFTSNPNFSYSYVGRRLTRKSGWKKCQIWMHQRCCNAAVQQYSNAVLQQCSNAAMQQCSNAAM